MKMLNMFGIVYSCLRCRPPPPDPHWVASPPQVDRLDGDAGGRAPRLHPLQHHPPPPRRGRPLPDGGRVQESLCGGPGDAEA